MTSIVLSDREARRHIADRLRKFAEEIESGAYTAIDLDEERLSKMVRVGLRGRRKRVPTGWSVHIRMNTP